MITNKKLTDLQAFNAMFNFLDLYYERTKSDDIGSLLGDMQFSPEGITFDPTAWKDWIKSIQSVVGTQNNKNLIISNSSNQQTFILTDVEAFNAMRKFLEIYYEQTHSIDTAEILSDTQLLHNGKTTKPSAWEDWLLSINKALEEQEENETHH